MMTTAVSFQKVLFCNALIVLTRKVCSSSGSEYPACPSRKAEAFTKLTARWSSENRHKSVTMGQFYGLFALSVFLSFNVPSAKLWAGSYK
jgi:hypothetical protein